MTTASEHTTSEDNGEQNRRPARTAPGAPGRAGSLAAGGSGRLVDADPGGAPRARVGLDLKAGVTFLVGENGSGKSTIVEALAMAYGLNPEGGSRSARHRTRETESDLASSLRLVRSPGAAGARRTSCALRPCMGYTRTWRITPTPPR